MIKYPEKEGVIDIYPEIHDIQHLHVTIIGDPKGLKYLAKLLIAVADYDQEAPGAPDGEREHIHLHAKAQLGNHSCEVEICTADAKETSKFPDFMI